MLALTFSQNVTGNVVMHANVSGLSTAGLSLWCNVRMCGTCTRKGICLYVCVPQVTQICERLSSTPRTNTQCTLTDSNPVQSLYTAAIYLYGVLNVVTCCLGYTRKQFAQLSQWLHTVGANGGIGVSVTLNNQFITRMYTHTHTHTHTHHNL